MNCINVDQVKYIVNKLFYIYEQYRRIVVGASILDGGQVFFCSCVKLTKQVIKGIIGYVRL